MKKTFLKPKVLIVEGEDEKNLFEAFLETLNIENIQIEPIGGKTKIRGNLYTLPAWTNYNIVNTIGIIRDADNNAKSAFQSVCDAVENAGLTKPAKQLKLSFSRPQVAIMILPDTQSPGMLEDLCLKSVKGDPAMECVDGYIDCLKKVDIDLPKNLSKARFMTYLASRLEADERMGIAAQQGYWNLDHQAFKKVKEFLRLIADG